MNHFRELSLLFLMMIFLSGLSGQERTSFTNVSPLPGSEFINPEQVITLRSQSKIDQNSLFRGWIEVTGSVSGRIEGETYLFGDGYLLRFTPEAEFRFGETIHVAVGGNVKDTEGRRYEPLEFSFKVSEYDNLPLLVDYYESRHIDLPENNITGSKPTNHYLNNYNSNRNDDLPPGFVQPVVVNNGGASDGYFFTSSGSLPGAPLYAVYLSIHDNYLNND
jgi:hypothetical protein